jgi:gluconate 2-dehydrogenase alpha chain
MGYHPFPIPSATASRSYKNIYGSTINACVHCGFCSSYACEVGAKGNVQSAVLPVLMGDKNFELRTHARVTKVNLDSTGKRATGVTYVDAQGREFEQPAELVLLMSYVFSNVRLMMLSGIGERYDPATSRGVVGRNYAYQVVSHVNVNFDDKIFNQFMGAGGMGVAIDDFNGDNYDHSGLGFVGGGRTLVGTGGLNPIESRPMPHDAPRWGSGWKKAVAQYWNRSFTINNETGCNSYRQNYLDLDPTYRDAWGLPLLRMTFDWREHEHKASQFITAKMEEIGKAIGAQHVHAEARTGRYTIVPYQSTHNTGGATMGTDPGTSAVNKYLQSWDVPNVFVVGASAFPQNAGYNPTDTVGALTYWALDAIKNRYLKRPGALA